MDVFNIIALIMLFVISITGVYVIIYIHDIPYNIAKKRGHPHQDAIHVAGWVSLFLMHTIWPILWIWAYLFKPGSPESATVEVQDGNGSSNKNIEDLRKELEGLRKEIKQLKKAEK